MYIPKPFKIDDWKEITSFVKRHPAVDLVIVGDGGEIFSTLLPCVWDTTNLRSGYFGTLITHISRGNEQWKNIRQDQNALAIVHGAQAYISPSNYENKNTDHKVVPTWNYQAVHLSGTLEVSEDIESLRKIVTELTEFHEASRKTPWSASETNPEYMEAQLKGIVAITMTVTKVEAKYKLSQNRSKHDQQTVAEDLANSAKLEERVIATEMQRNLNQG